MVEMQIHYINDKKNTIWITKNEAEDFILNGFRKFMSDPPLFSVVHSENKNIFIFNGNNITNIDMIDEGDD